MHESIAEHRRAAIRELARERHIKIEQRGLGFWVHGRDCDFLVLDLAQVEPGDLGPVPIQIKKSA